MATTYLSPVGNEQQLDANGAPVVGGKIFTYAAGTTTPIATYMDNAGAVGQTNPIVLNAAGRAANPIWLPAGQAVKFVFQDANGVAYRPPVDNVTGINDPASVSNASEWVAFTGAPTFVSSTSFSVAGDQTPTFQVGRRIKSANTGGTVYSSITGSSYNSGTARTTVTVANDSGSLDSGLSQVSYGLISETNTSAPVGPAFSAYKTSNQSITSGVATKTLFDATDFDTAGALSSSRWTPGVPGVYDIQATVSAQVTSGAASSVFVEIYKNGLPFLRGFQINGGGSILQVASIAAKMKLAATDYLEIYTTISGTGPFVGGAASAPRLSHFSGSFVRPA